MFTSITIRYYAHIYISIYKSGNSGNKRDELPGSDTFLDVTTFDFRGNKVVTVVTVERCLL